MKSIFRKLTMGWIVILGMLLSPVSSYAGGPLNEEKNGCKENAILDTDMGTLQAGFTTTGGLKDRATAKATFGTLIEYGGLYEAFQRKSSLLDDVYMRNDMVFTGAGCDYMDPISILKVNVENGKPAIKDAKIGISSPYLAEKVFGTGKLYLTVNSEELTGLFALGNELSEDVSMELTAEATYGEEKPYLYIEGEIQKCLGSGGLYVFARGEIDNQKVENKVVAGLGYNF